MLENTLEINSCPKRTMYINREVDELHIQKSLREDEVKHKKPTHMCVHMWEITWLGGWLLFFVQ